MAHPAMVAAALAAAAVLALSVTFPIGDTDVWQHLAVGRAIWTAHAIPRTNLWTWPTYGEPQVLPSWGFAALLWPFWAAGHTTGLFVWSWLTTLAAFGFAWAAARATGARGFTPLVALAACVLVYRGRSEPRPETLAAVLLALEIWILERRRNGTGEGSASPSSWHGWLGCGLPLVAIGWLWANVHISYFLGLILIAIHAAADHLPAGRSAKAARPPLGLVLLATIVVSFLNPFGWSALVQPFEYFFVWRHEPIYMNIGELRPLDWSKGLWNGQLPVMALWPLLALARARRAGWDAVELATLGLFLGLGLTSQRFLGPLAIASAPYLGRDLEALVRARRWPSWTAAPWARAGLTAAACVALLVPGQRDGGRRLGMEIVAIQIPRVACDWIAAHGVRGRGFNSYEWGGYLLWRFWPDSTRRPFMDIHQTGTREDRRDAMRAMSDPDGWRALDSRHHFDWALGKLVHPPGIRTPDFLAADTSLALVFIDDAAALYVRRHGPLAALADSFAYGLVPVGAEAHARLAGRLATPAARAVFERELRRVIVESPLAANALDLITTLLMMEGRWGEARDALERAHRIQPFAPHYADRRAMIEAALESPRR